MAFRSNGPVMLALPPFRGFTRRLVLIAMGTYFGLLVLGLISQRTALTVAGLTDLQPLLLFPQMWRAVTYSFVPVTFFGTLFALLALWMFGSALEDERGSSWLMEYFLVAAIGGGIAACVLAFFAGRVIPGLDPRSGGLAAAGLWPVVMALLVAYGSIFAEMEVNVMFVLNMKAKYMAVIWLLVYLALTLSGGDRFGPLTALCAAACGYGYLRLTPRRGLGWAGSEMWFGWRNAYYRAKRRRAAKKFTVYMRKQGKDANIDPSGRYVDPDGNPRDPNDKRWMN